MDWLLTHGSLGLIFIVLVVAGLGVPFPEELALLAAGALLHRLGGLPAITLAVCMVGVLSGDLLSDLSSGVTGEILFCDAGYNIMAFAMGHFPGQK